MRHEVCGSCKFFEVRVGSDEVGECRRRPPTVHLVQVKTLAPLPSTTTPMSVFPPTHATHWCGEWQEDVEPTEEFGTLISGGAP